MSTEFQRFPAPAERPAPPTPAVLPAPSTPHLLHHLLDLAAERTPQAPALSTRGGSLTYGELADASVRVAGRLRREGLGRGDRLVVKAADGLGVAMLVYAASRIGAVFSVLHEQVRGGPLEHVLGDCEPRVLVSDDPEALRTAEGVGVTAVRSEDLVRTALDPRVPGAHHAAPPTDPHDRGRPLPGNRTTPPQPSPGRLARNGTAPSPSTAAPLTVDPVSLIYTSGTTALPKAVVSTHQQVLFAASAIQACLGYRADDVVYCPLPLSFDYGLYQLYLSALSGARLHLGTVEEAGPPLLRSLEESGATVLPGVPSVADRLAWLLRRGSGKASGRLRGLRLLTNTGAALSDTTMAALRGALPGLRIQVMYGLTECKRTAIMPPDGDLARPGSCGLPLPGTEVFVVGDDGERLPAGEIGQFVVRGPHVMAGYWRRPELTAERFPRAEGLFPELRTGDYGRQDDDGYLYFAGRRDDLYKERGFRLSATEVEAAAARVEGVVSAAVLPPDGRRSAVLAVVADLPAEEVRERMRDLIEPFKIPRRCVRLDALPVNGNGKVDRKQLAALVASPDSLAPAAR
ncbi:class I adenylate-forming enzyme family protein [Streptomyces sp. DSM 40750]|uniref:class I adenylate-forming enzyme family protein n=1 Tax=Streptomyces sp. DSM 40750 TaxID=2801030 RepID=UPI00214AD627|nr:class I adenylate-forming enzyme family protein [Streptomyces sp. DSM 40750]UUU22449.1 acyl--CoA ligase [Streptomyces sp. DSM 40750]